MSLRQWQSFFLGVAVTIGCISWLSSHFGGLGHVPRAIELPGIAITSLIDRVPESIATSRIWPAGIVERLESMLDNYQCPTGHDYSVEIVHHSPVILRFRGFLPHGEAAHLLKLTYVSPTSLMVARREVTPSHMFRNGRLTIPLECTWNPMKIEWLPVLKRASQR
jgi:hypothetical protein